jgi:hypothetical protein
MVVKGIGGWGGGVEKSTSEQSGRAQHHCVRYQNGHMPGASMSCPVPREGQRTWEGESWKYGAGAVLTAGSHS